MVGIGGRLFPQRIVPILFFVCAFSLAAQQADHLVGIKKQNRERGELSLIFLFDSTQVTNGVNCGLSLTILPSEKALRARAARPRPLTAKTAIRPFHEHDRAGIFAAHFVLTGLFDFDAAHSYSGSLTIANSRTDGVRRFESKSADFLDGRKNLGDSEFSIVKKRTTGIHDLTTRDLSKKADSRLTVQFDSVPASKGVIRMVVYEKEGYGDKLKRDENKELFTIIAKARKGTTSVTVGHLPFGDYVILAFHDEDENNEQRTNIFSFEKVSFSRDARPQIGEELPPKWNEAKFTVSQKTQTIRIKLKGWTELLRTRSQK